jgi:hypothetical protein
MSGGAGVWVFRDGVMQLLPAAGARVKPEEGAGVPADGRGAGAAAGGAGAAGRELLREPLLGAAPPP